MKEKKYLIIGIVSTLILMLGFTLAYFTPQIIGEGKKMTVNTANLEIIFTDTSEVITEDEILPGWSTSKTFTIENRSKETYYYNISMKEFINTFVTDYLEYRITSTNGYNMEEYEILPKSETTSTVTLEEGISIEVGETHTYTIEFRYRDDTEINQAEDMNKTFEGILSIEEYEPTLKAKLLSDNPTILTRTDFYTIFTEENTGTLYKASGNETEDGNDVYYFAGNAQNNWVKFGKDQNDADLYWRIIRTNEDESVRLLYIGPDPATESAFIKIDGTYMSGGSDTTGIYNSTSNNTMYVGYMYGTEGSLESNRQNTTSALIKQVTDLWYSKTINVKTDKSGNKYDAYVSKTAIYCNDRASDQYVSSGSMYYASYERLNSASPSYKCGNKANKSLYNNADVADKFSVSTASGGNGLLLYGVAQITADEITFAGGRKEASGYNWYYYNSINGSAVGNDIWWTMSPHIYLSSLGGANMFVVYGTSYFDRRTVSDDSPGVRPVLSLKSCVKYLSGDGSIDRPYEVSVDSTCASLEN